MSSDSPGLSTSSLYSSCFVPEASGNFNPLSCYSFQLRKACFSETSLFICEVCYLFVFFVFPLDGKHRLACFLGKSF